MPEQAQEAEEAGSISDMRKQENMVEQFFTLIGKLNTENMKRLKSVALWVNRAT